MTDSRLTKLATGIVIGLIVLLTPGHVVLSQSTPEPANVTIHIVQDGETLESIAALYKTTVQAIQLANMITDMQDISVGQRLIIPRSSTTTPISTSQTTVKVGLSDTLTTLAAQAGTTPELLGSANKVVNPLQLYAGEVITVPPPGQPEQQAYSPARVDATSSFWNIALRANANAVALRLINQIANPNVIAPGSIIKVPDTDSPRTLLPAPWGSLVLHPLPLEQGRTGGLRLTTSVPGALTATFLSREIQMISSGTSHEAVFGIDRWTEPGLYPLTITFQDETGVAWTYRKNILITNGDYASEVIRASEETSAVLGDSQAVQQEAGYVKQNMSEFTPRRYWSNLFLLPVAGVLTSPFGTVRTYSANDTVTFHSGTDLAIKTGTPIYAPADGIVVDTGLLDIRGYATLIDHGAGVYTGYWHQASILVKPGDKLIAGQQIGTVGSTGFSTASHLHWEMWVGGVQVDPMQWVREIFP